MRRSYFRKWKITNKNRQQLEKTKIPSLTTASLQPSQTLFQMSDLAKLKSIESFVLKTLIARIQAIPVISGKIVLKHSKTGIDNNSNETTS